MQSISTVAALAFSMACGLVVAQSSVGEILDLGGRQLTPRELMSEFAGRTIHGIHESGLEFQHLLNLDGNVWGSVKNLRTGAWRETVGRWSIDSDAVICVKTEVRPEPTSFCQDLCVVWLFLHERIDRKFEPTRHCVTVYKSGERYFAAAATDGEVSRKAPVREHWVSK
jgi:hypothetical protein